MFRSTKSYKRPGPDRTSRPWSQLLFSCLLVALIGIMAGVSYAQQLTGTLSGTAYDQSGAAIPNGNVTLKNQASGDERHTVTNGSGYFTFSAVQPGSYTVTIAASGFQTWEQKDVTMNQADNRTLPNINLQVGAATTTVSVEAAAESVAPVDTGEVATTLNTQMLNNIALQGRDAGEVLKIMPGMAMTNGTSGTSTFQDRTVSSNTGPVGSFSANGTQPNGAMAFMLDGANLVDPGNEGTQIANINGDMTAEVKVLTSGYDAEYAKGPIVFQAISKSGGAQFHGEGYFYARNSIFNSNNSFNKNQGVARADAYQYYPGGNIGGPVIIPGTRFNKNHDKLFFWFGYEYMDQHPAGTLWQTFVPTSQMRAGNFTPAYLATLPSASTSRWPWLNTTPCIDTSTDKNGNLTNPNGNRTSCSDLPVSVRQTGDLSSFLDPNALALLKLYPMPNVDPATHGGNNFQYLDTSPTNRWEQTEKIDYSITENTKLSVSYTRQDETDIHPVQVWWAPSWSLPYPSPLTAATTANVIMGNLTHVFSPTLTNEFVMTYARYNNPLVPENPSADNPATIGFKSPSLFGVKEIQTPNIISWSGNGGFAGFDTQAVFGGGFQGGAFGGLKSDPALYDNVSKVAGTHTMKFGFYWDSNQNQQSSGNVINGTYDFETYGATTTGNIYADLLMGRAANYQQANAIPVDNAVYHQYSFFGQDSWKIGKRLTLNYGVRLDHIGQWYPVSGPGVAVFDPTLYAQNPSAVNAGLTWNAKESFVPKSGWSSPPFYVDPRVGFAYDLFGNGKTVLRAGYGEFRYQIAYNTVGPAAELPLGVVNITYPTNGGLTSLAQAASAPIPSGTPNSACGTGCNVTAFQLYDNKTPYVQNYSFTISQAMPWRSLFEVSYVGNRSRDLVLAGATNPANPNLIPQGAFFGPDPQTGVVNNPLMNKFPSGEYRPLQSYGDIQIATHGSYANYNSVQAQFQKQAGIATFVVNYTFSKVLGIRDGVSQNGASAGSLIDPFNLNANYGVLSWDHTHIFNATYIVNLPKPIHNNKLLAGVVNGWTLSGVTQLQSGTPLQPNTNGNLNANYGSISYNGLTGGLGNSSWLGSNASGLTVVPKLTCDPRSGLSSGQYFNPSCFTVPAQGTNGDIIWPYIKGPAFINSDLSIFKSFNVTEKQRVEFRIEAFNFLNHPNKQFNANGNQDVSLNFTNPSSKLLTQTNTNTNTTGFPLYTVGDRLVEFALKYYF